MVPGQEPITQHRVDCTLTHIRRHVCAGGILHQQFGDVPVRGHTVLSGVFGGCTSRVARWRQTCRCVWQHRIPLLFAVLKSTVDYTWVGTCERAGWRGCVSRVLSLSLTCLPVSACASNAVSRALFLSASRSRARSLSHARVLCVVSVCVCVCVCVCVLMCVCVSCMGGF